MSTNPTTEDRIIKVATEQFMKLGLRSVSMDDVARAAGVSKKTLYQIFENKRDLVNRVMTEDGCRDMETVARHKAESRDAIDEFLRNSRYFIREMRNVNPTTLRDLQKYYQDIWQEQTRMHQDGFRASVAENIERGMEEGLYRADLDAEIIAHLYVGSMMMIIDASIFPAQERPLTDIIRAHADYHFNGIVNAFGRQRLEDYLKTESLD